MTLSRISRRRAFDIAGLIVLALVVLPFVIYAVPQSVGATQTYIVLSGSMEPTLGSGDVIFVYERPPEAIEEGDLITYDLNDEEKRVTTHRVVEVVEREDGTYYRTKGDANEEADRYRVPPGAVVGEVPTVRLPYLGVIPFVIPYLGHAVLFAQSQMGLLLLVVVPAGLLVVSEVWTLAKAATADDETSQPSTEVEKEP